MLSIPTWIATAIGGLIMVLLATIGYLVRHAITASERRSDSQDKWIRNLEKKVDALEREQGAVDKKFLEAELANTRAFVDKEGATRDYISVTGRVDALHKRLDRLDREYRSKRETGD